MAGPLDSRDEDIVVEARGHRCPTPTLRLRRAAERAPAGSILRLIADDPLVRIDAPHFAVEAGLEFLGLEEARGVIVVRIRKPAK